jgi:uncharacterized protein YqgC (DUF456 family)
MRGERAVAAAAGPRAGARAARGGLHLGIDMDTVLWLLALVLIGVGVIGTVLPALPGAALVFGGIALAAWIDDFTRIPAWTLGILAALTILAWAADFVAAALGAQRAGASRLALLGAALGTFAGVFTGLWGLLFMPLVGAAVGEYLAQRDLRRAGRVGVATWIGGLLGTAAKVAIVFAMIGVFVAALLL